MVCPSESFYAVKQRVSFGRKCQTYGVLRREVFVLLTSLLGESHCSVYTESAEKTILKLQTGFRRFFFTIICFFGCIHNEWPGEVQGKFRENGKTIVRKRGNRQNFMRKMVVLMKGVHRFLTLLGRDCIIFQ